MNKKTKKTSFLARAAMTLFLAVLTTTTAWADTWPEYITDVILVGGTESEVNAAKSAHNDYTFISQDLNAGAGGDYIYLGYKKGYRASTNGGYITDIIVIDAEGTNPPSTVTYSGRTYYLCPYDGGSHFEDVKGNLNSNCGGGWNLYLYYTKANIGKQAVSSITVNSTKDGAINCYYTNGNSHETQIDLNRGLSGSSDVYMHLSTATKTNRPSADPVMASGLVYNNDYKQLIKTAATISSGTMYYNLGLSGSWTTDPTSLTALSAGTYTIYYYADSNSYGNASSTHSQTVTIAKSPNSITACMSPDVIESEGPRPTVTGDNLSTGAITYQYSTSQNGTYSTTAPTTAGTYWVKATIAADDNCYEYTTPAVSFKMLPDWALHNTGDSEADAYVITTTGDLDLLAQRVNAGNAYSGKYFRLGANITYSHDSEWNNTTSTENNYTPIGKSGATFKGHFDGKGFTVSGIRISSSSNYKGLFGYLYDGATVKNVILSDARIMYGNYSGGIAGTCNKSTITNCWVKSNVCIGRYSYVGGIAGNLYGGAIIGCRSEATLIAASGDSRERYGGIAGTLDSSPNVKHCIVAGATVPGTAYRGAVVGRLWTGSLTNNYYINCSVAGVADATNVGCNKDDNLADTNGARHAVTIGAATGVTITPVGTETNYNLSGITAYEGNNGIIYGGQLYAGAGETVRLNIAYTVPDGCTLNGFTDGNGNALADNGDGSYTLTMTGAAATVTPDVTDLWDIAGGRDGSTAAKAYRITTPAGLDLLAKKVTGTDGYTASNYSGKYFELGGNITYDNTKENNYTAIGTDSHPFSGKFDGKGYKVSGIRIDKNERYQAIFGYISGGTVKNLTVDDTRINIGNSTYNAGGIMGCGYVDAIIENCHATSTVTVSGAGTIGGIAGRSNGTIRGCTSAATVSGNSYIGGIVGQTNNSGSTTENNLVLGATVSGSENAGAIVGFYYIGTLVNNRYTGGTKVNNGTAVGHGTGDKGDIDGGATVAYQFPADIDNPSIMGIQGTTYGTGTYQGITAYENGLAYDGHLYYPSLWTGSGSNSDPYVIYSAEGLDKLATDVNGGTGYNGNYFALGADIQYNKTTLTLDLDGNGESDSNFPGIGDFGVECYFGGSLDGRGHTISGIVINRPNMSNIGLFAKLESNQSIENLTIANSDFTGPTNVGAIVGKGNSNLNIRNCHVLSDVTISGNFAGGIVGYSANVLGCTSAATVSGITIVGGIVGQNPGYTVQDCLYLGTSVIATSTSSKYAGAIIGNSYNATMANNYYTAYGLGGVGSDSNATGSDTDGARFAVSSTTKPDGFGDATATYGTGTYTGITAYGTNGLEYGGKYYWYDADIVTLEDNASNATVIVDNNGQTRNVVLNGRTLYKDGKWNTLCLPFDVVISGSVLDGAVAKTLTSTDFAGGTLTLNFGEAVSTIEAGKPYIIKWESGENIVSPVFENVTISNSTNNAESTYADFTGSYSPTTISGEDKTKLYLGADNKLYYPNAAMTIGACRGYFQLKNGLIAGEPKSVGAKGISLFVLDFGDENSEATGIRPTPNPSLNGGEWYDLSGRRLSGKPATPGLYIHNGNKIVIK